MELYSSIKHTAMSVVVQLFWYNLAIEVKAEGPVKISHGSLRASRLQRK
jgi:hypothetical protein